MLQSWLNKLSPKRTRRPESDSDSSTEGSGQRRRFWAKRNKVPRSTNAAAQGQGETSGDNADPVMHPREQNWPILRDIKTESISSSAISISFARPPPPHDDLDTFRIKCTNLISGVYVDKSIDIPQETAERIHHAIDSLDSDTEYKIQAATHARNGDWSEWSCPHISKTTIDDTGATASTSAAPVQDQQHIAGQANAVNPHDIGRVFVGGKRDMTLVAALTDEDKHILLTEHHMPPDNFVYPFTHRKGKNPFNAYLREKHLSGEYGCFKYSPKLQGVVCVPCAIFTPESVENNQQKVTKLGKLVNSPLQKYDKLTGNNAYLTVHLDNHYHKNIGQTFADNFEESRRTGTDIQKRLDNERARHVREQRSRLAPIIKTTILCGRIGVGYRGHRDDGVLDPDKPLVQGDGNFKALLSFRVDSGDVALAEHLRTAGKNATYISKTIQNELIGICGDVVAKTIIDSVKQSRFFSIIADETTDSSHKEQLCICLRYVVEEKGCHRVREEFLDFHTAEDLTGEGLATQIVNTLKRYDLDLASLVGQGYDGAAAMSGHISGVQTRIRTQAPNAIYVHCASHALNLVLNAASIVPEIRDMFSTVREITGFINSSPNRRGELTKHFEDPNSRSLKTLCETSFVERHDALIVFHESYAAICSCLEAIISTKDRKTSDNARAYFKSATDPAFVVALCCAKKLMALTIGLSESLQTVDSNLVEAMTAVEDVTDTLKAWRQNDGEQDWTNARYGPFSNAQRLAAAVDVTIEMPRLAMRQTKRNNVPASSPEEYFKRSIWYPYLDAVTAAMTERFSNHQRLLLKMAILVPSTIGSHNWEELIETVEFYRPCLGFVDEEIVMNEFLQWKKFCEAIDPSQRPKTPIAALDIIPKRLGNIKKLIWIFCTIPVTTCTSERSFSAMKLLKKYLRSRTSDDRLTGLALMYLHSDIEIPIDTVIDTFANMKNRRLDFVL